MGVARLHVCVTLLAGCVPAREPPNATRSGFGLLEFLLTDAPIEGRHSLPFPEQDYQAPYQLGRHIDGGVDVTFDGVPDILVSAPGRPGESPPLGRRFLFPRP